MAKPEAERAAFEEEFKNKTKFFGGEAYEMSRTPAEKQSFGRALHETMDLWYAHQGTAIYMLTKLPEGSVRKNGYDDSGWTSYERCSAEQIKKVFLYKAEWKLVLDLGTSDESDEAGKARQWPYSPDDFDALIDGKTFTNGADKETVKTLFRKMSTGQLGCVELLDFTGITKPTVEDAKRLGRCLNLCQNLKKLELTRNEFRKLRSQLEETRKYVTELHLQQQQAWCDCTSTRGVRLRICSSSLSQLQLFLA